MSERVTPTHLWFNGEIVPWEQATLHATDTIWSSMHTVFEGIRAYWNAKAGTMYISEIPAGAQTPGLVIQKFDLEKRKLEEFKSGIASGQRIVVVLRKPAGRTAVDRAELGEIGAVHRVNDVGRAKLEHPGRRFGVEAHERRIVEAVLDEVGEIVHLIAAETEATR